MKQCLSIVLAVVFCLGFNTACYCQLPFAWVKGMGSDKSDYIRSISIDKAGNIYGVGNFSNTVDFDPGPGVYNLTSNGKLDIFITKFTNSGDFVWAKSLGSTGDDDGRSIALDTFGNVYVTGQFSESVDFDPGP